MTLRVSDEEYLGHVDRWWSVMLPRLSKYLYSRGGPIVMAQVLLSCHRFSCGSKHISTSTHRVQSRHSTVHDKNAQFLENL